jgi:hypothetical protein
MWHSIGSGDEESQQPIHVRGLLLNAAQAQGFHGRLPLAGTVRGWCSVYRLFPVGFRELSLGKQKPLGGTAEKGADHPDSALEFT